VWHDCGTVWQGTLTARERHNIENRFRKPQDFRRAATRYEKLARCLLALVHLASAIILLRAFVNDP
jgi:transposase